MNWMNEFKLTNWSCSIIITIIDVNDQPNLLMEWESKNCLTSNRHLTDAHMMTLDVELKCYYLKIDDLKNWTTKMLNEKQTNKCILNVMPSAHISFLFVSVVSLKSFLDEYWFNYVVVSILSGTVMLLWQTYAAAIFASLRFLHLVFSEWNLICWPEVTWLICLFHCLALETSSYSSSLYLWL